MTSLDTHRFVVVDVEGNGQSPPELVEIAIFPMDGLTVTGEPVSWLVKPPQPIKPMVTRIHGIHNRDVEQAPTLEDIAAELLAAMGDRTAVAHNARVEYELLGRQLPAWKPPMFLDTLRLAKAMWPGLKSYSLDPLLQHARIDTATIPGQRHRAGFDTFATARLFAVLAKAAGDADSLITSGCLPAFKPDEEKDQGGLW